VSIKSNGWNQQRITTVERQLHTTKTALAAPARSLPYEGIWV